LILQKAREYFAKAGFTEEANDGVLRKADGTRLEFTLSHYSIKTYTDIMGILKNEAKKAGIDLILDGKDPSLVFTDAMDKKFELTAVAWAVQPPYFSFYEYFHSRNAYDEQGNIKPKTNNVFAYNDPRDGQVGRGVSTCHRGYRKTRSCSQNPTTGLRALCLCSWLEKGL